MTVPRVSRILARELAFRTEADHYRRFHAAILTAYARMVKLADAGYEVMDGPCREVGEALDLLGKGLGHE